MEVDFFFRKIKMIYHYLITLLFYKPFVKASNGKFIIINPLIFTPQYFIFGKRVFIRNSARLEGVVEYAGITYSPVVIFGDNVVIEQNFHLTCASKITIGSNTAIAANVTITDINHGYQEILLPPEQQPIEVREVIIGENCKIYNNSVILPGAKLGRHSIVAANSVVIGRDYSDFCVLAGSPAVMVKKYSFEKKCWVTTKESISNSK